MKPSAARSFTRKAANVYSQLAARGRAADPNLAAAASADQFNNKLDEETCTPKRASYARDLQDDALIKAGYPLSNIDFQVTITSTAIRNVFVSFGFSFDL